MTFEEAVRKCGPLGKHWREGLQAVAAADRKRLTAKGRGVKGSVHVEAAQKEADPEAHTWDYGVGIDGAGREIAVWVEVHSANSRHVQIILKKHASVVEFLRTHGPDLHRMRGYFVWLATGTVHLTGDSRERRLLNSRGIVLRSQKLDLDSFR